MQKAPLIRQLLAMSTSAFLLGLSDNCLKKHSLIRQLTRIKKGTGQDLNPYFGKYSLEFFK